MRDIEFIPCKRCEFFDGNVSCIIDNRNLYTNFLKEPHCENFILKDIYSKDDVEYILKEKREESFKNYDNKNFLLLSN